MIFVGLSGIAYYAIDLFRYAERPADANGVQISVTVSPGQDFGVLSNLLGKQGLVSDPARFRLYARLKGYDRRIKAGEYALSSTMSPSNILRVIMSGKVQLHRITIPEGYTIEQIARAVEKADLGPASGFLGVATDAELLDRERIEGGSLEGYLFPDTYYFPKGVSAEKIIRTMVSRFQAVFPAEWKKRAEDLGFSIHDVVILASIIEKETGAAFERPLISSVFHNRFKKRMRLESDPTVIYGIENFDGNITRKHLTTPSPYNTYTTRGLPFGPIANPGKASLEAALYPADTSFLYFVSKGDGTHQFSVDISAHNQAVRKYQLRR